MAWISYPESGGGYGGIDSPIDFETGAGDGGGVGITDPPARDNTPTAAADPYASLPSSYGTVKSYYQSLLGRDPENTQVVGDWLNSAKGNLDQLYKWIASSPEGLAYAKAHPAGTTPTTATTPTGSPNGLTPQQFITQWQQSHSASEGIGPLAEAIRAAGYGNVGRYMYGATPSNNELTIDGSKFKVLGGEDNPNTAYWYTGGNDSGGAPGGSYAATGGNPGGYTDPSSMLYLNQVLQRLGQVQQPQDSSILDLLKSLALKRVDALNAPPYTAADEAALITKYRDPLTQARDAAYQRNRETASMKGFLPSSGLLRHMDTETNKGYEQGIAQGANQMAVNAIARKESNAQQQLAILSNLLSVNNNSVDRSNAMADQAVNLAKLFPDFDTQRLNTLLGASSDTGASSALNSLLALGHLNSNTLNDNNANAQANSAAWAKLLAQIFAGL